MQQPEAVTPSTQPLLLRTLGGLGLYRGSDDTPLLPPGKPIALLVYLSALPGRRANREHLINLLWSDRDPTSARHALRQTTWYLRQRLGSDALEVGNDHVALTAPLETDRESFLAAVEEGRVAEAVATYRGEFLGGFAVPGGLAFEHWAEAERQRLQLLFRHAAESLARDEMERGHSRSARELAQRVRDTDPFDESGWRLLIEACLAQDDRVSALAEGQRLRQLLAAEERTLEPATHALLRRVNAQPEEKGRPEDGALVAELVGRERQFSTLLTAFQQARQGSGRVVLVTAPPGLGKTRLLLDLARRLQAGGTAAVYVRAQPGDRDIPGSYVAEVARQLASRPGAGGVSPASAGSLVALDPSISGRFPALPDPSTGDEARRRRVAALTELIQSVSDEHPFALALDDLHWADAYSRDVLEHTIPHSRGARALFALAARPGGALHGVEADESLHLEPLTREQIEALVASLGSLPDEPWAPDFAARLEAAAEGSPLLVLETLQLALESGALSRTNGTWSCSDQRALLELLKAGSALGRRIAELDRPEGWLLLLLALVGTPVPTEILSVACGQDRERTLAGLMLLERRGLVARHAEAWSVAHDEIAERAEANADPRQRTTAHGALGRALLAASDRPNLRSAAQHLAAASLMAELDTAAAAWVQQARANGDHRSARTLLAELTGRLPGDDVVRRLTRALPWTLRVGHTRHWAAAAAVAVITVTGMIAAVARAGSDDPGVIVGYWVEEPGGRWRMKTHELTNKDIARGSIALASFKPSDLVSPTRPEGLIRPGQPGTIAATSVYTDSGGLDVVLSSAAGNRVTRITSEPGDDYAMGWSPDGRYLAIATDRWAEHSRSDIALLNPERPDAPPVRITHNPAARDATPLWSPDGSRIAFNRGGYGGRPPEVCMISADGHGERCLSLDPEYRISGFSGWVNPVEVVGSHIDPSGNSRILAINATTHARRDLAEGFIRGQTHAAGWIPCLCRRTEAEPLQLMVLPVARPELAIRLEPGDSPQMLTLFPARPPRSYLERLRIDGAERPVPVDGTYRLQLRAWDAAGKPIEPLAVRWTSSDTTIAIIDSTGTLHPRKEGGLTVAATAGGWRTISAEATIGAAEATTVTVEDWGAGLARWVPFGEPRPLVVTTDRGAALAPNGDSTNSSGAFLRKLLPATRGIGVEFDLSAPLTSLFWQNLHVLLLPADSLDISRWNLQAGTMDLPNWRECGLRFPAAESEWGQRNVNFGGGISRPAPAPPSISTGKWTRIRLQYFPDGRCGVALDGEARGIADGLGAIGDSALLFIDAYSHRTRLLVGRLEVWTGVRRDVDWDAVRQE